MLARRKYWGFECSRCNLLRENNGFHQHVLSDNPQFLRQFFPLEIQFFQFFSNRSFFFRASSWHFTELRVYFFQKSCSRRSPASRSSSSRDAVLPSFLSSIFPLPLFCLQLFLFLPVTVLKQNLSVFGNSCFVLKQHPASCGSSGIRRAVSSSLFFQIVIIISDIVYKGLVRQFQDPWWRSD